MSSPSLVSVQHLRKVVGYMKHVGDVALRLDVPAAGQGSDFSDGAFNWILKKVFRRRLVFKQGPPQINLLRYALFEHCLRLWKQQESENNLTFLM